MRIARPWTAEGAYVQIALSDYTIRPLDYGDVVTYIRNVHGGSMSGLDELGDDHLAKYTAVHHREQALQEHTTKVVVIYYDEHDQEICRATSLIVWGNLIDIKG